MNQMPLSSSAFIEGQAIPKRYSCDGEDVSPQLFWKEIPAATKSLALIVDDPDAPVGTFVHWVIYDIPPGLKELQEGIVKTPAVDGVGVQGVNGFRKVGYNGPCPPKGSSHRYFFKLYALDLTLGLPARASKADVEKAMKGHILAQGQLMGTFSH